MASLAPGGIITATSTRSPASCSTSQAWGNTDTATVGRSDAAGAGPHAGSHAANATNAASSGRTRLRQDCRARRAKGASS